ncbi:GTP-binding protein [Massiliimalia timonensis]|uniref:GTP-binding protein n=1 Tax=Massiliimalia timonensis TaxID=1987501 RepID=UPI0018A070B7|nr:TetM/TetW/TetO/TetS family tetracycline resistance ribosomal protection protein [Massiliimalia timonensis]
MNQTVGILAHVDAGKTTVAEQILYHTGSIRKRGRVDHQDTFLDTHQIEKQRGITIFSGQAVFTLGGKTYCMLDTPGHVDFSAEMERAVGVMDCAVLVISCVEGIQGHTETVWRLLKRHRVPVFLFLNKTDRAGADPKRVMEEIRSRFSEDALWCGDSKPGLLSQELAEQIAERDDELLEVYLEEGYQPKLWDDKMVQMVQQRRIFPCFCGSALQDEGIDALLLGLEKWTAPQSDDTGALCADVYRVRYDEKRVRRTYLKIQSGTLRVKEEIAVSAVEGEVQKINELYLCHGEKLQPVSEVKAGMLCMVTGLEVPCGSRIGSDFSKAGYELRPLLSAQVLFDSQKWHPHEVLNQLKLLEAEDPMLQVAWDETLQQISLRVMGEIQLEILKGVILDRFGLEVTFGDCRILYLETLKEPVIGRGHFEPLRHYAEVHLRLSPAPRGTGVTFDSECSLDVLDNNFQNLIRTHVLERVHKGVLTGAPVADLKITLLTGRAHNKHTEGGDFRQATYRAVRQGLMKGRSVVLEPYYRFRIDVPNEYLGRVLSDIQRLYGTFEPPQTDGDHSLLTGRAPAATFRNYQRELVSFTAGRGSLSLAFDSYEPCHNEQEVIAQAGYEAERDVENPADSVFCSHGAGFPVKWQESDQFMHCK